MMQKQTRKAWLLMVAASFCTVSAIAIAAVIIFGNAERNRQKNPTGAGGTAHTAGNAHLAALIEKNSTKPLRLAERAKEADCAVRGSLPDPECTPGAVFPGVGTGQICGRGYTKTARNVPIELKNQIYAEYGLAYPQLPGAYEADHLIPLELGGNNDVANLFPEAADPQPGFREKDLVENYLNHEVCAGHVSLTAAQEQISRNWLLVYNNLTPGQIDELRQEFAH